jgi:hypothetical protein
MAKLTPNKPRHPASQQTSALHTFDSFEAGDRFLCPHSGKPARWIFSHFWLIFLIVILLVVGVTAANVLQAEKIDHVFTRLRLELSYPFFSQYTRCFVFKENGSRYIYVFRTADVPNCAEALRSSQPIGKGGWFSEKESLATNLLMNTLIDALPFLLSVFITILLFHRFTHKVPATLSALARAGRLLSPDGSGREAGQASTHSRNRFSIRPRHWSSFAGDLESAVRSPIGTLLFLFFLILGACLAGAFAVRLEAFAAGDFWQGAYYVVVLGFVTVSLAYVAGYGLWVLFVAAAFIRNLTPAFRLDIQPEHSDNCGGLKRLGDLCFDMALMIVAPAIVIGAFVLLGVFDASIPEFKTFVILALAMAIGIAALVFFWPLFDIHRDMLHAKDAFQDEAVSRIAPVKARLRDLIGSGKVDDEETQRLEKQLEKLNLLYPADMKYPTWPFTTGTLLVFYTGQILPVVTVVTGLVEFAGLFSPSK